MAILPNTGITTSMVANTIGEISNDVGTLCTSSNINMWSKWKPIPYPLIGGLIDDYVVNSNCGFIFPQYMGSVDSIKYLNDTWTYVKPTGGSSEPYRLGDFRNYDHSASIPFDIIMTNFISGNNLVIASPGNLTTDTTYYNVRVNMTPDTNILLSDLPDIGNKYLTAIIGNSIGGSIDSIIAFQSIEKLNSPGGTDLTINTTRLEADGYIDAQYNSVVAICAADKLYDDIYPEGVLTATTIDGKTIISLKADDSLLTYVDAVTGYHGDGQTGGNPAEPTTVYYTLEWSFGTPNIMQNTPYEKIEFDILRVNMNDNYASYDIKMFVEELQSDYTIGSGVGPGFITDLSPINISMSELETYGLNSGDNLTLIFSLRSAYSGKVLVENGISLTSVVTIP